MNRPKRPDGATGSFIHSHWMAGIGRYGPKRTAAVRGTRWQRSQRTGGTARTGGRACRSRLFAQATMSPVTVVAELTGAQLVEGGGDRVVVAGVGALVDQAQRAGAEPVVVVPFGLRRFGDVHRDRRVWLRAWAPAWIRPPTPEARVNVRADSLGPSRHD
jgi:hypothetical protein